ncbi:glycogen synthase GlgA [Candidatus Sumerlaeota bacterium]|nr:glycogen synthase GlgA [Candidatus Sumerlaeota bacterium]
MKIFVTSSEVSPYAKTGGLADVAGSLPRALAELGHDVRVAMPLYTGLIDPDQHHLLPVMRELDVFLGPNRFRGQVLRSTLPGSEVPIYFIQCDALFDREGGPYGYVGGEHSDNAVRFAFASLAMIWLLKGLGWSPDIIQTNDWQMALIPTYLRSWPILSSDSFYSQTRILHTIHNLAYQGLADPSVLPTIGLDWSLYTPEGLEFFDKINLMKGGIVHADHISTVSPRYALEIQTEEHGCGLEGLLQSRASELTGILNGIDTDVWNPATDTLIQTNFSADRLGGKAECKAALQSRCGLPLRPDTPLIGMVSRLVEQKGFGLLREIIGDLLRRDIQLVILGTGDPEIEKLLADLAAEHGHRLSFHRLFDERLAHGIEAGADMFLMPSRYEPCGLNQLYSMRYGTIPIVHFTGGLVDSVRDATPGALAKGEATGFGFSEFNAKACLRALTRALDLFTGDRETWRSLMLTAMAQDFSWAASARAYEALFKRMLG